LTGQLPQTRVALDVEDENDRYHRQNLISWWDQDRLRDARVLVVGAGALGNELVKNLVLMGVGRILVVDSDRVENSNLARCVLFRAGDDGELKADVVARRAQELNADVEVVPIVGDVRGKVGLAVFEEVDVVLGGLDNREARLFVNQACWKTSTPWVDGAIEGLMGVVRVFVPPESACYECTMNERDRELMNSRRTCALLTREEMLDGKVPTTATAASVVAAMQVQEAVKLLHADRLGPPALAGAGFHFVGLTHDSYVVTYRRDEDCLSHDTYAMDEAITVAEDASFRDLLACARETLGPDAALELEHEIVLGGVCGSCDTRGSIMRPAFELDAGSGLCPECSSGWRLEFAHAVDEESALIDCVPADVGLPPADVVVGRSGFDRCFLRMTGGRSALEVARA
jgi:adenylyltransferase/sulfurtransferase